jgi:hypothetical protein
MNIHAIVKVLAPLVLRRVTVELNGYQIISDYTRVTDALIVRSALLNTLL